MVHICSLVIQISWLSHEPLHLSIQRTETDLCARSLHARFLHARFLHACSLRARSLHARSLHARSLRAHFFFHWVKSFQSDTFLGKTGNSNTGNTARAAFNDYETFAEILGWDEHVDIIRDLHYIILAVNSTCPLDPEKFDAAAHSWLDRFHDSPFKWNTLNPTVHSLMHHGADLIRYFRAPLGLFSEEGPEANNKIIRQVFKRTIQQHT